MSISPSYVDGLELRIKELGEQVEKLTESYDQCGRTVQEYGRTITQTELRLHEVATHCVNVEEQLAALAEQNEKMRVALQAMVDEAFARNCGLKIADDALSLPDLASPILNRIRAEGMREAINIYSPDDSAQDWVDKISARADKLENSPHD